MVSYQSPTQEPVGISGDKGCFDFEQQNNDQYDIEQLIYEQNRQYVPDLSKPHITIVVATSLTGTDSSSVTEGEVVLQGALIAQEEYNEAARKEKKPPLRLLVANDGSNAQYAEVLADDIATLAKKDKTVLGVVGWPFSTLTTETALTILEQQHIVSISPTLSSNDFTGVYSYFFRIVPPDLQQGMDGALFAETKWHPKKVVIFVDYANSYSRSLATSFAADLEIKNVSVYFVRYVRDEGQSSVPGLVQKALINQTLSTLLDMPTILIPYGANYQLYHQLFQ
jgi:ABC-type branched-subunit amino acid transport system substrate-binding protein